MPLHECSDHDDIDTTVSSDLLAGHGLWVKRRNGTWKVKVRTGGDRVSSQLQEMSDPKIIAPFKIRSLTREEADADKQFGLRLLAGFVMIRQSWTANKLSNIVLDLNTRPDSRCERRCCDRCPGRNVHRSSQSLQDLTYPARPTYSASEHCRPQPRASSATSHSGRWP